MCAHKCVVGVCVCVSLWLLSLSKEEQAEENTCSLSDLQEGLVGKMLVRKSGRVQLILGHVTLDVALGTPCAFLQVR